MKPWIKKKCLKEVTKHYKHQSSVVERSKPTWPGTAQRGTAWQVPSRLHPASAPHNQATRAKPSPGYHGNRRQSLHGTKAGRSRCVCMIETEWVMCGGAGTALLGPSFVCLSLRPQEPCCSRDGGGGGWSEEGGGGGGEEPKKGNCCWKKEGMIRCRKGVRWEERMNIW